MQNHKPNNSDDLDKLFSTLADGKHPNALAMLAALSNVSDIMTSDELIDSGLRALSESKKSCHLVSFCHPDQQRCSCCD